MKATTRTPNSQLHSAVNFASSRHVPEDHHSHNVHHQQLPSAPPESGPKSTSFTATFRSVFQRLPSRAPSAASLHSSYSAASSARPQPPPPASDYKPIHPYATMVSAPLPVVSSHDAADEEDECPVCLEPLSFSFRLPGEKPHIVPECGHALHEVSLRLLAIRPVFACLSLPALAATHLAHAQYSPRLDRADLGRYRSRAWLGLEHVVHHVEHFARRWRRLQSVRSCFYEAGGHLGILGPLAMGTAKMTSCLELRIARGAQTGRAGSCSTRFLPNRHVSQPSTAPHQAPAALVKSCASLIWVYAVFADDR